MCMWVFATSSTFRATASGVFSIFYLKDNWSSLNIASIFFIAVCRLQITGFFSLIFLKNFFVDRNHAFQVDKDIDDEVSSEADKDNTNDAVHPDHNIQV